MSECLDSQHDSKEICEDFSNDQLFEPEFSKKNASTIPSYMEKVENSPEKHTCRHVCSEQSVLNTEVIKSETRSTKYIPAQTKEIHETSPFKQAVKGFVLNKLSKKVGSSNILSGIREKIVKRLEEDEVLSIYPDKNELSTSYPNIKEPLNEEALHECNIPIVAPLSNSELKSVVANDFCEVSTVEEATECLEEFKSSLTDLGIADNALSMRTSISLPTSPVHRNIRASSSINYSSLEQNFEKPDTVDISYIFSELKKNNDDSSLGDMESTSDNGDEELNDDILDENNSIDDDHSVTSDVNYPENIYEHESTTNLEHKKPILEQFNPFSCVSVVRSIFASLTLSHILLILSVIIHLLSLPSYMTVIFNTVIIAYVLYSYLCNITCIELDGAKTSSIDIEDEDLLAQELEGTHTGSVKILKGRYNPDDPTDVVADNVDITVKNNCLKISYAKVTRTRSEELIDIRSSPRSITYVLTGGKVSLVPKDISRTKIWRKRYPICVILPKQAYMKDPVLIPSKDDNFVSDKADYVSDIPVLDPIQESSASKAIYIFTLTDREKEYWYWVLHRASKFIDTRSSKDSPLAKMDDLTVRFTSLMESNPDDTDSNVPTGDALESTEDISAISLKKSSLKFDVYIRHLLKSHEKVGEMAPLDGCTSDSKDAKHSCAVDWLNLALGRMFYDFLTQKKWSDGVKHKIQKKFDKINMPKFMEALTVTDIFLGTALPKIKSVSSPVLNSYGIWFDLDFQYDGSFQMTLETKLKISDDKKTSIAEIDAVIKQNCDTSESSEDDAGNEASGPSKKPISQTHKKAIINMLEKWVSTKHFQNVAQSKFVKKYVCDISNMPLMLTVEVSKLHGDLAINIPPVPTDRLWYGFRKKPSLSLNVYPRVGNREINLSQIVQFIEKKLVHEFQKALVMPNMEDLLIPIMYSSVYSPEQSL